MLTTFSKSRPLYGDTIFLFSFLYGKLQWHGIGYKETSRLANGFSLVLYRKKGASMESVTHPIPPVYDTSSKILILGSFPSVKSREYWLLSQKSPLQTPLRAKRVFCWKITLRCGTWSLPARLPARATAPSVTWSPMISRRSFPNPRLHRFSVMAAHRFDITENISSLLPEKRLSSFPPQARPMPPGLWINWLTPGLSSADSFDCIRQLCFYCPHQVHSSVGIVTV